MDELEILRKELRKIDKDILKLIKKRLDIAKKIGEVKKSAGLPLKNWELEKKIIKNTKLSAKKMGISEETSIEIMQKLIGESCHVQEITHYLKYDGGKEDILIIGGNGKMGKWFANFFRSQGHNVLLHDIKEESEFSRFVSLEEGLANSSISVITTPMKTIPAIMEKIIELGYKGVVFDISSIKSFLSKIYKKALNNGISVASIHPLFGPKTKILSDKILCYCDLGNGKANTKVKSLFKNTALNIVKTSFEEHDKIISYVLNFSHFINIIYSEVLRESGFDFKTLSSLGSTTFFSQIKTTKSIISEDPELYFEIQTFNLYKEELYKKFSTSLNKIIKIIENKDVNGFNKIMKEGRKWIKG